MALAKTVVTLTYKSEVQRRRYRDITIGIAPEGTFDDVSELVSQRELTRSDIYVFMLENGSKLPASTPVSDLNLPNGCKVFIDYDVRSIVSHLAAW